MPNSIEVVEEFRDSIFKESTIRWGDEFTIKDLVYHLIENGIISPKTLKKYMMFKDLDKLEIQNNGHISTTFMDLSIKHNICEKECRNIIYKQRYKMDKDFNIKRED